MTPLRIATIGAGYFSQFHHDAWTRIKGAALAAVCDTDRAKAEGFAARFAIPRVYTDAAAMLDAEKPDLVDIVSPPPSHLALIRLAVARGIDVICQKPFCRSLTEARAAVDEAEHAHGTNAETEIRYHWSNTGFGGDSVRRLQEHLVEALRASQRRPRILGQSGNRGGGLRIRPGTGGENALKTMLAPFGRRPNALLRIA